MPLKGVDALTTGGLWVTNQENVREGHGTRKGRNGVRRTEDGEGKVKKGERNGEYGTGNGEPRTGNEERKMKTSTLCWFESPVSFFESCLDLSSLYCEDGNFINDCYIFFK